MPARRGLHASELLYRPALDLEPEPRQLGTAGARRRFIAADPINAAMDISLQALAGP